MKKIIIIICLCPLMLYSQYPGDVIELNTPQEAGTIKACHSIILKPGFSFSASAGKSLILIADESVCTPYIQEPITLPITQNYIVKVTPLDETENVTISSSGIEIARNARSITTVQYFDGLGRPVQTVQKGYSPNKKDLVMLQEYDDFGRESNIWLPAPQGSSSGDYVTPATVKTSAQTFYNGDTEPYSYPVYENSPLNRVLEQYGPGQDWHNTSNAKSVKTAHKTNSSGLNCIKYTVSGNNLVNSGDFESNQLYVTETIDEDGNYSYIFTDKLGRTLLTRFINDSENHDVYYVYDDLNNLRFVLPPLAVSATGDEDNPVMKNYAYVYKYDSRNRMIFKQLPGCEHVKYIYDKADRLIFWQDGELRDSSKWMFSIPDIFGRIALTGTCGTSALGKEINAPNFESSIVTAKKSSNINSGMHGYDIYLNSTIVATSGLANMKELTVNWYDNYNFLALNAINNSGVTLSYENNEQDFDKMYGNTNDIVAHKGRLTGSAVVVLESNTMLYSAFYYDYRGRVIQSKSTNHLGGAEKEYIEYDFIGNPLKKLHIHTVPDKPEIREEYENEYDHAGRLLETKHKLGESTQKTIAVNKYDEVGRLKSTTNGSTPIINYTYDVRSRLKTIVSTQFAQELFYTFGGNIDELSWRNKAGDNFDNYFTFEYDNLSRLKKALHSGNNFSSSGHYNEHFEYDKHGNIESLKRYTKRNLISKQADPSLMDSVSYNHYSSRFSEEDMERGLPSSLADNLSMQYDGNKLIKVAEASSHKNIASDEYFFMDWNPTTTTDYLYTKNGAMRKDENKGMTIDYNVLNLPKFIAINNPVVDNGKIYYTYSADGIKRRVKHTWPLKTVLKPDVLGTEEAVRGDEDEREKEEDDETPRGTNPIQMYTINSKTTDYVGNKIYLNGQLDKILLPNGYIKNGVYFYYVKDHISNNRVVIKDDNFVVQRVDYYANSGVVIPGGLNPEEQNFKHQGCEFDPMHGLNITDHGNRGLDHAINRYFVPDKFAEKFPWQSPYVHAANNGVNFIDVNGDSINVTGTFAPEAFQQIVTATANELTLNMQSNGTITATQSVMGPLTYGSTLLLEAANSSTISVMVTAENTKFTSTGNLYVGGTFMGNTVLPDGTVIANQEVNPGVLGSMSDAHGKPGADMIHEVTEAYMGGVIAQVKGVSSTWEQSHPVASPQSGPVREVIYNSKGREIKMLSGDRYPKRTASASWYVTDQNGNRKVIQKLP